MSKDLYYSNIALPSQRADNLPPALVKKKTLYKELVQKIIY